eukprot:CAMPEP_0113672552 /NCGR_PEP_ID=MMETSP0038_2-20120614/6335_1 /TAXON_ID=2898 /ORGANISM="Cryptomonas paramecium" /LENGTH=214 /DNA_ID=CAMNT_0000588851 /DNA_START=49 /DNA_END=690 /DNA_ORIENTATION=- /assembly_acc=CAM_ASM_000170
MQQNRAPANEEGRSPASWKERMRKALADDLEEALADDSHRESPKPLVANGGRFQTRGSDVTSRTSESLDSQSNEVDASAFDRGRTTQTGNGIRELSAGPKVPLLWNQGETPRVDGSVAYSTHSKEGLQLRPENHSASIAEWTESTVPHHNGHSDLDKDSIPSSAKAWGIDGGRSDNSGHHGAPLKAGQRFPGESASQAVPGAAWSHQQQPQLSG